MTFRHLQTTTLFFLAVLFGMQDGLAKDTPKGFLLSESLGLIRAEQSSQLTDQALLSANAASIAIAYVKKQDLVHYTTAFNTGFIASNFKITKADNEKLTKVILERAKSSKRLVFLPWEKGELALFGAVSMQTLSDEEIVIEAVVCASDWKEAIKLENEKPEVALSKSAVWSSISRKKIRVRDLFVGDRPSSEAVLQEFLSLYARDMAEVLLPSVENISSVGHVAVAQEDLNLMLAGEKQTPFIDKFARLARDGNESAVMALFDSKLINDFGEGNLRKSLSKEIFPFFSQYDKLRNYDQVGRASVDDGRVGLWHYTFIVDTTGKVLPFQMAVIDTEGGLKVLSLLVGQCTKGRHPRIPPCE